MDLKPGREPGHDCQAAEEQIIFFVRLGIIWAGLEYQARFLVVRMRRA